MKKEKIMEVKNISKSFSIKKGFFSRKSDSLRAVNDVSFSLYKGETLAIVGESGCGKSTVRKLILNLLDADSGEVYYKDKNILSLNNKDMRLLRKEIQVIFQDPYSSLNPKWRIGKIIEEPLVTHRIGTVEERKARVKELLEHVGINPNFYGRYPHEFSGGQRQRIGIARALALEPEIIVADEPVSALDVSIQAQVLNMFKKLQKEFGLTYIFISHDLSVVKHISDRVAVMYLGEIVEVAKTKELYDNPKHPYTKALMASIPLPDPNMEQGVIHLKGEIPSPINPPSGCTFHPRCPMAMDVCKVNEPKETLFSNNRKVKCHLYSEEYTNEKKESS